MSRWRTAAKPLHLDGYREALLGELVEGRLCLVPSAQLREHVGADVPPDRIGGVLVDSALDGVKRFVQPAQLAAKRIQLQLEPHLGVRALGRAPQLECCVDSSLRLLEPAFEERELSVLTVKSQSWAG